MNPHVHTALAIALALSASSVAATTKPPPSPSYVIDVYADGSSTLRNINKNVVNNHAVSQSRSQSKSSALSSVRSTTGPVSQSVTVYDSGGGAGAGTTVDVPDNTPDMALGVPPATSPCRIAVGGGFAQPGLGVQIGFSTLDEGCDTREDARALAAMGMQREAVARLCQKEEMRKAMGDRCKGVTE